MRLSKPIPRHQLQEDQYSAVDDSYPQVSPLMLYCDSLAGMFRMEHWRSLASGHTGAASEESSAAMPHCRGKWRRVCSELCTSWLLARPEFVWWRENSLVVAVVAGQACLCPCISGWANFHLWQLGCTVGGLSACWSSAGPAPANETSLRRNQSAVSGGAR